MGVTKSQADEARVSSPEMLERIEAQERELAELRARLAAWEANYGKLPSRDDSFTTISAVPVEPLYSPANLPGWDYMEQLGLPGEFPYTRGPYTSMYRTRLWTMRQFASFGTSAETVGRQRRVRLPVPHGLRLRPSPLARRGGEVRRGDQLARRHGNTLRWHPARRRVRVDDHQRSRHHHVLLLCRGGGEAGRVAR